MFKLDVSVKKTKITIFISLLISCISIAQSQDLILTYSNGNVTIPLDSANTMTVESVNGNINITTSETAEDIGSSLGLQPVGSAPNISFQVALNASQTAATITTTITNEAVYCQQSGLWGAALTTSSPPVNYVTSIIEQASSNSTNYILTCANSFGITTNNATVGGLVIVNNPVVTISASPTTVSSGGSSTITWSVTNSPDTCTFTGDWPSGMTKDGPYSFVVNNITTNQAYSVLCDNAAVGNSGTQTANVSLLGASVWQSCTGVGSYVLNGAEDRTIIANNSASPETYSGYYDNLQAGTILNPWPGNWGDIMRLSLEKNKYIAAKFTTDNAEYDAKFVLSGTGNFEGPTPSAATYIISECPGDFNVPVANQAKCKITGNSLFWSTKDVPGGPPGYFCELEKNTTYYLNMVHSDNSEGNNYATSDCASSYCGILAAQSEVTF